MTTLSHVPDSRGRFGEFGGRYVPGTPVAALAYAARQTDHIILQSA